MNWIIFEIFTFFILPVVLWHFKIIPFKHRFWVMMLFAFGILTITFYEQPTLTQLGLVGNFKSSVAPYLLATILAGGLILFVNKLINKKKFLLSWHYVHFPGDFIIVALVQEFAYRSFLMWQLGGIFNSAIPIILTSALLFALPHMMYKKPLLATVTSFVGGLLFAGLYFYYPNYWLVSISHMALNYLAFSANLFETEDSINHT